MAVDSVLVVGATGRQGGRVARHLLDDRASHDVDFTRFEEFLRGWA